MAIDYDPQKAHEYYEQHKKLKGRKSGRKALVTRKFSQQQKEQWEYAKSQLSDEHKAINKDITESARADKAVLAEQAKEKISQLREMIKNLPKEQKAAARERISGMVDSIRAELKQEKESITESSKSTRQQESEDYKDRKEQAYDKIASKRT